MHTSLTSLTSLTLLIMKPKLLVILGPTASGKTALSLTLAQKFNGEIISADSRQLYRGMDIGTDKLPLERREGVPHHLIDIVDPDEHYTVADFQKDANRVIGEIHARGAVPIMAGGTGLYISAVIENYRFAPSGKSTAKGEPPYDVLLLQPAYDRGTLYTRINERVDEQLAAGLVDEARALAARYGWDIEPMTGIGYRQYRPCIEGDTPISVCADAAKQGNRNYAKRQITWFKRYADRIVTVGSVGEAERVVREWLTK